MDGYDIIGDVHGSGAKLHGLLDELGWKQRDDGVRRHDDPNLQVIFVGDLIDRGEDHGGVLSTVRSMVDAGTALIVMGNHEFNAISYATPDPREPGEYLRKHSEKNNKQHREFLAQLDEGERADWIEWFRTLPIWLDLGELRIVHACWHQGSIEVLERAFGGNRFPDGDDAFVAANTKGDPIYEAVEVLLKGPELDLAAYSLPEFRDEGGQVRDKARVQWWKSGTSALRDLVGFPEGSEQADGTPYPEIGDVVCIDRDRSFAYSEVVPVFYGHHWRSWAPDEHLDWTTRTACVDFSAVRGGPLVAYRWRGEAEINHAHYVAHGAG